MICLSYDSPGSVCASLSLFLETSSSRRLEHALTFSQTVTALKADKVIRRTARRMHRTSHHPRLQARIDKSIMAAVSVIVRMIAEFGTNLPPHRSEAGFPVTCSSLSQPLGWLESLFFGPSRVQVQ